MPKFRKKPVEIDAVQWGGGSSDAAVLIRWMLDNGAMAHYSTTNMEHGRIVIVTLEGDMQATPGDWIIQGVKGEFYPCKPDVFEQSYEPAS
jgi:hypothetical protein